MQPNHIYILILPSSGSLRGVRWIETDVLGLPIGSFFKGQDGTDRESRNVGFKISVNAEYICIVIFRASGDART